MRAALKDRLRSFWIAYHSETIVFLIVFAAHALFAIFTQLRFGEHVFVSYADAFYFYYQSAQNLLHYGTLSISPQPPFLPDAYHTPLYSLFLAALLALKLPLIGLIFAQNILIALTAVLTYRIGITLFSSDPLALFSALAAGLEPMNLYWGNLLMSDNLFAALCIASFYLFLKGRYRSFALAMGLATLTRPLALYFFVLFLFFMPLRDLIERQRRSAYADLAKTMAITLIIFMIVLTPWIARNKIRFNAIGLSTAGEYELYTIVGASFAKTEHIAYPPAPAIAPNLSETRFNFSYNTYYQHAFLQTVLAHPAAYITFHLSAVWTAIGNHGYEYLVNDVILAKLPSWDTGTRHIFLIAMIAAGNMLWFFINLLAFLSVSERFSRSWWVLLGALLALNLLIAGVINPSGGDMSRYMLPFTPLILLFAGTEFKKIFLSRALN